MRLIRLLLLSAAMTFCLNTAGQAADGIKVIIDTDIGEDIDDILCMAFGRQLPGVRGIGCDHSGR